MYILSSFHFSLTINFTQPCLEKYTIGITVLLMKWNFEPEYLKTQFYQKRPYSLEACNSV